MHFIIAWCHVNWDARWIRLVSKVSLKTRISGPNTCCVILIGAACWFVQMHMKHTHILPSYRVVHKVFTVTMSSLLSLLMLSVFNLLRRDLVTVLVPFEPILFADECVPLTINKSSDGAYVVTFNASSFGFLDMASLFSRWGKYANMQIPQEPLYSATPKTIYTLSVCTSIETKDTHKWQLDRAMRKCALNWLHYCHTF